MDRLKLILPTPDYESEIMDYRREFIENGERIYGSGGLKHAEDFSKWYRAVCNNLKEETLVRKGLSPETTLLAINGNDSQHLLGMITIRHRLNDVLLKFGGHIDYSVRKSERNKGYGSEILRLALKECRRLDIKRVLLTCDKNNMASAKTIINNGGILENEIHEKNKITQRYWISLD